MNLQPIPQISNRCFANVSEKLTPSNGKQLFNHAKKVIETRRLKADAEALNSQLDKDLIELESLPMNQRQA